MNLLSTPEFKVGVFVVAVATLVGAMSMRVSESPSFMSGGSKEVWFEVDNAGGLIKKSPVNVAGIRVGVIDDIQLRDGKAVVRLAIRPDVQLTESAKVEIRANGILGDKHVEIIPGSSSDPVVGDKQQIVVVEDNASIDRLVTEVSRITKSLSTIVDNIRDATEGDDSKPIGKIVANLERITTDVSDLVDSKKGEVSELISHLNRVTATLDELVNDPSETGFKSRFNNSLARLDNALGNIDEISSKINQGEGTIGRLVNDEDTVEELNTAITGVNRFLNSAEKIETSFDYYSHVFTQGQGVRSYVGVRIQPGIDRFYEIAGVTTPEGVIQRQTQTNTVDGGDPVTTVQETRHDYRLRLTALFGKNFYDFTVKAGMIESRGGIGFEYKMFREKLRLSFDAFDFDTPNLRAYMRYSFFKGLYVVGGHEVVYEREQQSPATFIGAGLFLTNDDIKALLF